MSSDDDDAAERFRDTEAAETDDFEKRGQLKKLPRKHNSHALITPWQTRDFSLDEHGLRYYAPGRRDVLKGELRLNGGDVEFLDGLVRGRRHCFLVKAPNQEPVTLSASNPAKRDEWAIAIRRVASRCPPPDAPSTPSKLWERAEPEGDDASPNDEDAYDDDDAASSPQTTSPSAAARTRHSSKIWAAKRSARAVEHVSKQRRAGR